MKMTRSKWKALSTLCSNFSTIFLASLVVPIFAADFDTSKWIVVVSGMIATTELADKLRHPQGESSSWVNVEGRNVTAVPTVLSGYFIASSSGKERVPLKLANRQMGLTDYTTDTTRQFIVNSATLTSWKIQPPGMKPSK